jgi:predicted O-linked N-acetylglucosamine transferase (SPINDLY family)
LYMGVPCVTMAGAVHAHNVGASLLSNVGEDLSFQLFISSLS